MCAGVGRLQWVVVLSGSLLLSGFALADDLAGCMVEKMQKVDDAMTVGELR